MPIVLMQRAWRDDPQYLDTEFVLYHFPRRYFDEIRGGEQFVYYRPSRGAPRGQESSYFGCGVLGDVYDDPDDTEHRFVEIEKPIRFAVPVSFADNRGAMYESRFPDRNAFQGRSIRHIDELDFFRILASAGLTGAAFAEAPSVASVIAGKASPVFVPPRDAFRPLSYVPRGTGYKPSGIGPSVFEAAELQERARADHQDTIKLLKDLIERRGGSCEFNNNVDLLARMDERSMLVEVKSLVQAGATVDRMRYGIGQLADYSVRYRAEIADARPVLAFGSPVRNDLAWISTILQESRIALLERRGSDLYPMNDLARDLALFS